MYKLPDHFFIPLMYVVIFLIQRSLYRMRTLLRFLVIAELGGDNLITECIPAQIGNCDVNQTDFSYYK